MKKIIKVFAGIVIGIVCFCVLLATVGSKSIKKENELAESGIKGEVVTSKAIEEYATMSQDERTSQFLGKHMEIMGTVDKITSSYIRLSAGDFDVVCYVDNAKTLGIDKNMIVTLDGVCTYNAANNMRLRLCTVTNMDANIKPEPTTEDYIDKEEKLPEESVEQQTSEETISADENLDVVDEILKKHNETRKATSVEYVQGGMLKKEDKTMLFLSFSISEGLYGCSSELLDKEEQLQKRLRDMTISDTGAIVYFEDNDIPEYYVDLGPKKLYNTYFAGSDVYYLLDAGDKTIKEDICTFYYGVVDELSQQVSKYEYEVDGAIMERNQKSGYVVLYGTARNALMEKFEGYIRVNYGDDKEFDFSSESIAVTAYALEPSDSRSFDYDGRRALFLETDNIYKTLKESALNAERISMIFAPNTEWQ